MTPDETPRVAEAPGPAPAAPQLPPDEGPSRTEVEHDAPELLDAIGAAGRGPLSFVYAPRGNFNSGAVHGGQRVHNASAKEARGPREGRVREGPVSEAEVRAAAFGYARPDWFGGALAELRDGPLFLAGRPGSGRRTAALNLLRESCGEGALLRALDSVTELDRWQPTDPAARGYLMDGLFPSRPLGPGVLGHVRSLLERATAHMVIMLPDDAALLHRLEQDLHVRPVPCVPPLPAVVFSSYFEELIADEQERERLLAALTHGHELSDLLVPELVPAEVVELVTAIVTADGDPDALGDLGGRLSYRAEREVPDLMRKLRDDPDALAFLLAASVYEGLDHRLVSEEAARLLKLSEGRLSAELPLTDSLGTEKPGRPNPDFVFRRSLTDLLHTVRAVRQERVISTEGAYAHSVQGVVFVRHRQAEAVLRHVWCEYGQLSDLLVEWLRGVERTTELTQPVGQFMGRAARWGGGRHALRHIQALAESDRTTSRLIAANALGIAAEDPVLVAEVRYRLQRWSLAAAVHLRTTVAYTCGAEFGLSRPDLALRLLHDLLLGMHRRPGDPHHDDEKVLLAVRVAILSLFQAGNELKVLGRLVEWLEAERCGPEQVLPLFGQLLQFSGWFVPRLAVETPETGWIVEMVRRALNAESSFDTTCTELLKWADWSRWDEKQFHAVENLFVELACGMRFGEFRLFVELDEKGADGWAGLNTARTSLSNWRSGQRREAA
ncbi:hypothetical protein ACQPZG_16715 [Streptomyces sp. CA-294286]|uniref:hypothetical protein n=1 Tax=Streptomyces sp. CA-294286 TaxID=3240070 RepID=UPI003D8C46B9